MDNGNWLQNISATFLFVLISESLPPKRTSCDDHKDDHPHLSGAGYPNKLLPRQLNVAQSDRA